MLSQENGTKKAKIKNMFEKESIWFVWNQGWQCIETEDGSENDMLEPGCHQLPSIRMLMKRMKKISNREEVREYRRRRLDVDNELLNISKAPRKKGCSDIK